MKFNVYDKHEKSYKLLVPLKIMLIYISTVRERERERERDANLVTHFANFDQTTLGYLPHIFI